MTSHFTKEFRVLSNWDPVRISGRVIQIVGLLIESAGPSCRLGELCYIYNKQDEEIPCEVVGFRKDTVLLMPLGEMTHIAPGSEVYPTGEIHMIPVTESMCGRVVDALGQPMDGKGPILKEHYQPVWSAPPGALSRTPISDVLATGVRAIDGTCTAGRGQRFGIFAGSGVGKSTLLSMIAKNSNADINVIGLIGERGREVREFIERDLGEEGLKRSIVVVATSDQPALLRAKGASVATAIAEYYRSLGKDVVLMMDSVTRYAMALREIGLAVGEPPTTKGYTPSVFAQLPKLLERAGSSAVGTITGIYTILVEGDDMNDPIADTVRGILDGHLVLSRKLASANHYPPIDVLQSLSRVMSHIVSQEHLGLAGRLRAVLQVYREAEDLINIGAYVKGSNPKIDEALALIELINEFLAQGPDDILSFEEMLEKLSKIFAS